MRVPLHTEKKEVVPFSRAIKLFYCLSQVLMNVYVYACKITATVQALCLYFYKQSSNNYALSSLFLKINQLKGRIELYKSEQAIAHLNLH